MNDLLEPGAVRRAGERIRPHVLRTPLFPSPFLSERAGRPVHLKLESLQHTGSFKVRGAANLLLSLDPDRRDRGVVACSSGNHGRAVAHVAWALGIEAMICVPEWVDPSKAAAMEAAGARVIRVGSTYDEAEDAALGIAREEDRTFASPFDDPRVVAGQGTLALEVVEALPDVVALVVPISGGGLAGGIAAGLGEVGHPARVAAASARRARTMVESLRHGRPVEVAEEETVAEALAGGIGRPNRVTFELVRRGVHRHALVPEDAIRAAMRAAFRDSGIVVEGGGAVALAAVLTNAGDLLDDLAPGPVVVVVSGGNVSPERFRHVMESR